MAEFPVLYKESRQMFKKAPVSPQFFNVLIVAICGTLLALPACFPGSRPELTKEQLSKVRLLHTSGILNGLQAGDFLTLQGETYVVVDPNWRMREDRSLVLNGPGPSSSETADNETRICLDDSIEALIFAKQLDRGHMIMQKDPYGLKRDAGWEVNAAYYWLQ